MFWKPSLFPLGDSDIRQNIWGLIRDPLTGETEHFQDRGEGYIKSLVLRQNRKVQCKSEALLGSRKVSGTEERFLYKGEPAGVRLRPADALGGSRLRRKIWSELA